MARQGCRRKTGKTVVRIDPTYFRPTEVDMPIGDASKAREKLGWKPKTSLAQLVKEMVAGGCPWQEPRLS
jgi:GDPmannose 4,6-dehydratase